MKKIYVLLMHTNTIPSKLVKFFTRYKYSHVGIALEKDCKTIYSFGRKSLRFIFNAGFSIENKDGEFFRVFNNTMCKIYEIEITDEQFQEVKSIIDDMSLNIDDYKYDFIGVIARYLGIPIKFKNKYVCSYFVADILKRSQICDFVKETYQMCPKDFENLKEFKEIYQGDYLDYGNIEECDV